MTPIESPRFYFITRRYAEAINVLDYISKANGKGPCQITEDDLLREQEKSSDDEDDNNAMPPSPEDEPSTGPQRHHVKGERVVDDQYFADGQTGARAVTTSGVRVRPFTNPRMLGPLFDLFHPSIIRTTVLLTVVWWALNFGWYGLTLWLPTLFTKVGFSVDIYQDTFLVSASNLPGNILVSLVIDRVGRKNLLGSTLLVSTGMVVLLAFIQDYKVAVVTLACAFNAISCGCWNTLDCLSTESFPTKQRTTAMVFPTSSVCLIVPRLTTTSASYRAC
jgi:hypothetical protein